jgi:hypothetical protein
MEPLKKCNIFKATLSGGNNVFPDNERNISYEEVVKVAVKICYHTSTYTLDSNHLKCAMDILYPNDYERFNWNYDESKYGPYLKMAESTLRTGIREGVHHRYPSKLAKDATRYMACVYHYNINSTNTEVEI